MAAHALDDMTVFREYEPRELGRDGYPLAWRDLSLGHAPGVGVKDLVRDAAGERCQRCNHPYVPGCGTWGVALGEEPPPSGLLRLMEDEPGTAERQRSARDRPPLWSPCDERCTHGGPLRCIVDLQVAWQDDGSPATKTPAEYGIDGRTRYEAAWRILTVHHLNERKHDLRWWNLAALCQRCHLTIQRKVTMENPWPWEPSEWFRPHAAAWYALRYLGEHLTYTQTLARLDELLALGSEQEQVERMAL